MWVGGGGSPYGQARRLPRPCLESHRLTVRVLDATQRVFDPNMICQPRQHFGPPVDVGPAQHRHRGRWEPRRVDRALTVA
jgi:hypothetical protein